MEWESAFREQSRRRWSRHARERVMKGAVLALLAAGVVVAVGLRIAGVR
jgi:hypothetical protein